jgi:hypothetical protein
MVYLVLANLVVIAHLAFVLFVLLGALCLMWRPRLVWVHLPAAVWGTLIEFGGWGCPLTPLENWLREKGGAERYETGFIARYILPILYPGPMTRDLQIALGFLVLLLNLVIYGWLLKRARRS